MSGLEPRGLGEELAPVAHSGDDQTFICQQVRRQREHRRMIVG
jgi:hypothetical protein